MKIVINSCFGGFGLSEAAYKELGLPWDGYGNGGDIDRTSPELISCVEKLGRDADGDFARLKVIEIPDDIEWEINDYDGAETVTEKNRTWS